MEQPEVNEQQLRDTARALVADDKGLLAMDESNPTCNKRFAKMGIPQTTEARRAYREMMVTTPGLSENISGAILYDEPSASGRMMARPLPRPSAMRASFPALKSALGAKDLAGHPEEKITEGFA
jgi:fructose-bisphosphate aldolase, class I